MINRLSVRIHSYVQRLLTRLYRNKIGAKTVSASLSRQNSYTYGLSIVAIAKNEGSYILEWVSYHKAIGVDHIFIYDNGSTDSTVNVIRKFIDDGYVTLIEYPGDKMQLKAYNNAINTFANKSAYIAFIDCDEFLVADGDIKSKVECLFNTNDKVGAVTLNWAMFGSDGYESRPEGLVIENYLHRAAYPGKGTECIKSIVRPKDVKTFLHPHFPILKFGKLAIDCGGKPVYGWRNPINKPYEIRINHYFTKSKEEWILRRSIGKADLGAESKRSIDEFYAHDNNEVLDKSAADLACNVKDIIAIYSV